jgi:MerR family transcriptional regulator, light-induced transcriptional regulator
VNQPVKPEFVPEAVYRSYLGGLLAHDRRQCSASFQQWLEAEAGLRSIYEDLVRRSLYEVGDLWERGRISVATEHLATAVSESLLNLTYPRLFAQPRNGKSAVITCVPNEYHQIGGKMVADVFELNGWRGYFLGANTPVGEVIKLIGEKQPDVVALSVATSFGLADVVNAAAEIRAAFPEVAILAGGQAFRWGGRERVERVPGVRCLTSLGELETWIEEHGNYV